MLCVHFPTVTSQQICYVLAAGITLKYRYRGGPTFSQLHSDNAPPLGLFLWGRTAQREQGWWARAGKAASLGGWGRWLHVAMEGGGSGGRRRLSTRKQMRLFCAFPQEGSVWEVRRRSITVAQPPCEYSEPVPFVPETLNSVCSVWVALVS